MTDSRDAQFPPPTGAPVELDFASGPTAWENTQATWQGRAEDHTLSRIVDPPTAGAGAGAGLSILARARLGDDNALATMFRQFLPQGEAVLDSQYLGVLGLWGIGTHSFVAVTPRRVATLQISFAGGVEYQDGLLEFINSSAVFQPSRVRLYLAATSVSLTLTFVGAALGVVGMVLFFLLSLILLPVTVRVHYRFQKSGIVLWVREGIRLDAFIDRRHMRLANQLYRLVCDAREDRLLVHRPT